MTEDERREAERLAQIYYPGEQHTSVKLRWVFCDGFSYGRESVRQSRVAKELFAECEIYRQALEQIAKRTEITYGVEHPTSEAKIALDVLSKFE